MKTSNSPFLEFGVLNNCGDNPFRKHSKIHEPETKTISRTQEGEGLHDKMDPQSDERLLENLSPTLHDLVEITMS